MILYFSATGNCKYVAQRVADATGQEAVSILDCIAADIYDFEDESIGIITPVYNWTIPSIVHEFLEKVSVHTEYLFIIATYGTITGAAGKIAEGLITGKNADAFYSVRMPDTWTPMFDLSTPEKVARFSKNTENEIESIINSVKNRHTNRHMKPSLPAFFVKTFVQPIYDNKTRRTSSFYVEDSCIGCGLCEKKCPVNAIQMIDKKPVWVKDKCIMCLGCLHRCPKFAIQYGNGKTKQHGQYTNPHVKV